MNRFANCGGPYGRVAWPGLMVLSMTLAAALLPLLVPNNYVLAVANLVLINAVLAISLSMVLGTVLSLPGALWASRREQALLMLLPGMPRGAALNRALAWRQARHFLLLWALTLPAYLGLAWAGQVPQVLALPAVALTAMAWLWRNAAQQREPSALTAVLPFVVCLVPGIASIALLREKPDLFGPLLGGVAVVAALSLLWRWRQLSRWPQALPAGRWG